MKLFVKEFNWNLTKQWYHNKLEAFSILTFALWLNLLSSHLTTAVPLSGMKGFLSMSMDHASSKLQKIVQTKLLFIDIIAIDLRLWSIEQK